MGNILVDLDATFGKFQFSFLSAYQHGAYDTAAQILFQANSCLPAQARVTDMEQFKESQHFWSKAGRTIALRAELSMSNKAKEYCDKWAHLVWASIADYREDMLARLEEDY